MLQKVLLTVILAGLMLSACMGKPNYNSLEPANQQPVELSRLSSKGISHQDTSVQAKQALSEDKEVIGVRAVNDGKDQLLVGVKLRHHDRVNKDELEKQLHKKVQKQFSDKKIMLSTDEKIHLELKKLEDDLQNDRLSKKDFQERLKKIKKLSGEQT